MSQILKIRGSLPVCLTLLLIISAVSCVTIIKPESVKKINRAAILSIACTKEVDTSDTRTGLISLVNEAIHADDLKLTTIIESLKTKLYRESKSIHPFAIIPENKLFAQKAFQDLVDKKTGTSFLYRDYMAPKNYPIVTSEKDVIQYLNNTKDVDAAMIYSLRFALTRRGFHFLIFDFAKIRAEATLGAVMIDKAGKEIVIRKIFTANSDNSLSQVVGVYNVSKVHSLCLEASDNAYKEYTNWLKTNLK